MFSRVEWPEPVERVAAYIREAGAEARVEEFAEGTPTAADAARAVGCAESQIVKSLVVECDERSLLVLVPGNRRADTAKVARAAGCARVAVAGRAHVREATGFEPGAVAPFPVPGIDRRLKQPRLAQVQCADLALALEQLPLPGRRGRRPAKR